MRWVAIRLASASDADWLAVEEEVVWYRESSLDEKVAKACAVESDSPWVIRLLGCVGLCETGTDSCCCGEEVRLIAWRANPSDSSYCLEDFRHTPGILS